MQNRYYYKISIRFSDENPVLAGRSDMQVLYSKYTTQKDTFKFNIKSAIKIEANRDFCLSDRVNKIYGNGNSIHIQIRRAILLYCLTCDKCVTVRSITMSRKSFKAKTYYYKEIKKFKQPFPERSHDITSLPLDVVKEKMGHAPRDYAFRVALSYFLREQYSLHPYHKFECLWRAYNCLFRDLTGKSNDNAGIREMIKHVMLHPDKYSRTFSHANAVDLNDKMFKFKAFFVDKVEHLTDKRGFCSFVEWLRKFTKVEILDVIRQNESAIDSKIDIVATANATIIKPSIHTYLTTTSEDVTKVQTEKFIFMLWYAYFLRNMYFHAVIREASFTLYSEYNDKHLMCMHDIMETFLREIFEDDKF